MSVPPPSAARRVSIVLPTFNRAALLRDAIAHCLAQTHADLELVIVDDGSTDATPDVLRAVADPRVVALRHEHNRGLPESLNTGFRHASGAYLTWSSDDDRFAPTAIAELLGFLDEHPEVDFVYADFWIVGPAGDQPRRIAVRPPSMLAHGNCIGVCRLYRRAVYEAIGDFDPATRLAEDYDYWVRVARRFRMAPLHRALYWHRRHPESLTGRFRYEAQRVAERVKLAHGLSPPAACRRALDRLDVAEALARGQRLGSARLALRAIARDPRALGNRQLLAMLLTAVIGAAARRRLRAVIDRARAAGRGATP